MLERPSSLSSSFWSHHALCGGPKSSIRTELSIRLLTMESSGNVGCSIPVLWASGVLGNCSGTTSRRSKADHILLHRYGVSRAIETNVRRVENVSYQGYALDLRVWYLSSSCWYNDERSALRMTKRACNKSSNLQITTFFLWQAPEPAKSQTPSHECLFLLRNISAIIV
jgi:hypothetical protein